MGIKPTNQPVPPTPDPQYTYLSFPPDDEDYLEDSIHRTYTAPREIPESEYLQEENTMISDDQSEDTDYNYETFVNRGKSDLKQQIPLQIPTSNLTTTSDVYLDDLDNTTPFLKSGRDKSLPRYSGRATEDINAFFY